MVRGENATVHRHKRLGTNLNAPMAVDHAVGAEKNMTAKPDDAVVRMNDHAFCQDAIMAEFDQPAAVWRNAQCQIAMGADPATRAKTGPGGAGLRDPQRRGDTVRVFKDMGKG